MIHDHKFGAEEAELSPRERMIVKLTPWVAYAVIVGIACTIRGG